MFVDVEWDEAKRAFNIAKHGVDFALIERFDWESSVTVSDDRRSYGEDRFRTFGSISGQLHVLVWTPRHHRVRIISLRKANRREVRTHEATAHRSDE